MGFFMHDNFEEILKQNSMRLFVCISEELTLYHPFPTISITQNENFRKKKYRTGGGAVNIKYLPQADGSRFPVYTPSVFLQAKYKHIKEMTLSEKVNNSLYKECLFWNEKKISLKELELILLGRDGYRLSYLIYVLHQFANAIRVVPILIDWVSQEFYNLSFVFSQHRPEDGFGVLIQDISQLNTEMHLRGVRGFQVIEYMSSKRICMHCGQCYDIRKNKKITKQEWKVGWSEIRLN